jgi:hypothetical protein
MYIIDYVQHEYISGNFVHVSTKFNFKIIDEYFFLSLSRSIN